MRLLPPPCLTKPVEPQALLGVLRQQVTGPNSRWVTGLSVAGVQELADWLENNGCRPVAVSFQGEAGFALRCVCPRGPCSAWRPPGLGLRATGQNSGS
jgi:hypothetical protein